MAINYDSHSSKKPKFKHKAVPQDEFEEIESELIQKYNRRARRASLRKYVSTEWTQYSHRKRKGLNNA